MTFDYIIMALLATFFINGWLKGFFRSLIGPLCFIFFSLVAVINFDLDQNLVKALCIVSIGTFVSSITAWLIWMLSRRTVPMEERYYLFWGSRALGGVITLGWRGLILALMIMLLTILPETIIGKKIKQVIQESRTYALIQIYMIPRTPYIQPVSEFIKVFSSPTWSDAIKESARFQDFIQNNKIQRMVSDPETMKEINNKDFVKLISNQRVIDVINDEKLMREFTYLAQTALQAHAVQDPIAAPPTPAGNKP